MSVNFISGQDFSSNVADVILAVSDIPGVALSMPDFPDVTLSIPETAFSHEEIATPGNSFDVDYFNWNSPDIPETAFSHEEIATPGNPFDVDDFNWDNISFSDLFADTPPPPPAMEFQFLDLFESLFAPLPVLVEAIELVPLDVGNVSVLIVERDFS